jgi:outer membrane protein assembly factor BamB
MGGVVLASPAITNDLTIYVGTENNRLYSVNGSDGKINWNYLTSGSITSSASLSNSGDIYFGSNDKKFYSLGKTGTLNWSFATNGSIHSSPAIDTLGRIYFGSTDGKLYSLNPDGSLNWSFQSNGSILSSPAIDFNGNIYIGSGDSSLYSIDVNGNELWKYKTSSSVNGNPSLTSGGNVIFGCDDGTIYSLSEIGELNWSYKTDLSVESSPLVTSNGRIYVGSNDKSIYGFLDSESLQLNYNHQWPTFQKDNKRTGSQLANTTSINLSNKFDVIKEYKLNQNYPNPFNPSTTINYSVAKKGNVSIIIFDALGREIATLVNEEKSVGSYKVNFNAELLTSGIYFYQMKANDFFQTKKMILLR